MTVGIARSCGLTILLNLTHATLGWLTTLEETASASGYGWEKDEGGLPRRRGDPLSRFQLSQMIGVAALPESSENVVPASCRIRSFRCCLPRRRLFLFRDRLAIVALAHLR